MYRVLVHSVDTGVLVDAVTFPFGEWKEIGFWLDDCGYNDKGFKLTITFHSE